MISDPIPLGFSWPAPDPFIFCVHHVDAYPEGNDQLGPNAALTGRQLGSDFDGIDGWRMYHGSVVPGFPQHPHRGFETVTIAKRGLIDHSDSLGATGRFGAGDVQWMTAGAGIVHSEMFPLVHPDAPNPLELFQIWLNLPSESKLEAPYFTMLWRHDIPTHVERGPGGTTEVTVIAGRLGDVAAPAAPPSSWASRADSAVAIWTIAMEPGAQWTLPTVPPGTNRTVYFFRGSSIDIGPRNLTNTSAVELQTHDAVAVKNGPTASELLLLQGRPIGEPVVQHGPFVMNSREEILKAIHDYQRTGFGGWPWSSDDPVHERDTGRFARHADGRTEHPPD